MSKKMQNGGVIKTVEDGDVDFHINAGWTLVDAEPKPASEKEVAVQKPKKKKAEE